MASFQDTDKKNSQIISQDRNSLLKSGQRKFFWLPDRKIKRNERRKEKRKKKKEKLRKGKRKKIHRI